MGDLDKPKILVLCGPTATGKTALSIALAKRLQGEIVGADSMQIYKHLDVGTAKPTIQEMQGIPHHLIGFVSPEVRFSVAEYVQQATRCIEEITARNKLPIFVGGTGQYIQSLITGMRFTQQNTDLTVRLRLQNALEKEGIEPLFAQLKKIDEQYASTLHINNEKRILRALELYEQTGKTMTQQLAESMPENAPFNASVFALTFDDRNKLYERINVRVDCMLQNGLLEEAKFVYDNQTKFITAAQAIGYKEFFPYFAQESSLQECTEKCKQASRNYAKRQLTWFKRMQQVQWLQADALDIKAICNSIE